MKNVTKRTFTQSLVVATCFAAGLASMTAQALPSDAKQQVVLSAENANFEQTQGRITYMGAVELKQGTILLNADKVVLTLENGKLKTWQAIGNPATLSQDVLESENSDKVIKLYGQANEMNFIVDTHMVDFTGNAKLSRAGTEMTSNNISYNLKFGNLEAKSQNKQRVQIIIPVE